MVTLLWVSLALTSTAAVLFLIAWRRARPGSGDAVFAPSGLVQTSAILVGILPQIFTPKLEALRITGSIASIVLTVVAFIIYIYRRRARDLGRA